MAIAEVIREARVRKRLTQEELARKLDLHQKQISGFERGTVEPKLSTLQNVARALDLELMLVPRHLIAAVQQLMRAGTEGAAKRPMYALGDEEENARDEIK